MKTMPASILSVLALAPFLCLAEGGGALGEADDKGNYILSEKALSELAKQGPAAADAMAPGYAAGWGTVPLGPDKPTLNIKGGADKEPVFAKRPTYGRGLKIAGGGTKLVIVYQWTNTSTWAANSIYTRRKNLANELAWHVRRMCPSAEIEMREWKPGKDDTEPKADETTVIFAEAEMAKRFFGLDFAGYPIGTSFLRRKDNWFLVGGDRAGRSHALTYVLETMGCRYLWPSENHHGKIIPAPTDELFLPDFGEWAFTPALKSRGVRVGGRRKWDARKGPQPDVEPSGRWSFNKRCKEWLGITEDEFIDRWQKGRADEGEGNRDFWAWHGVLDETDLPGEYKWGHYFGDYWVRFGKGGSEGEHLEFFALQPNGSRDQGEILKKHGCPERATLCLSNRGLVEQVAKDICWKFRNPRANFHALSLSLPDAGPTFQCMCENCRRLDPKVTYDGKTSSMSFGPPFGKSVPYPRLTDRVIWFNNEVARIVRKEFPGKRLTFQGYNSYNGYPSCVAPDPCFAVFAVDGDYSGGLKSPIGKVVGWSQFGIEAFWRPNVLWGFRGVAPQNYARRIFEDIELAKANHCVGTDFDTYYDRWSQFGFCYYMLAVAHLNPDRLSFDDVADDYFRQGFGPAAAAMREYWDAVEKMFNEAAATSKEARESRKFYHYHRHLRFEPLDAAIAKARERAAGDELLLARIRYFASALDLAKIEHRIVEAFDRDDLAADEAAVLEYYKWVKDEALKDMPSNNPDHLIQPYFVPAVNWLEWSKKESTKVQWDQKHYDAFYRK